MTYITEIAAKPPFVFGYHGKKQIIVIAAIGKAIHLRYGLHFPHLLRVLSTIEPIMGSFNASNILAPSIRNATAKALKPIASVMNIVR